MRVCFPLPPGESQGEGAFDPQARSHSTPHLPSHSRPKFNARRCAPATWSVWLGCEGRAPEGQPLPCGASPFPSCTLSSLPPRNCICMWGVAGGVLPQCIRALIRDFKNHPIQVNSQITKEAQQLLSKKSSQRKQFKPIFTQLYTKSSNPSPASHSSSPHPP